MSSSDWWKELTDHEKEQRLYTAFGWEQDKQGRWKDGDTYMSYAVAENRYLYNIDNISEVVNSLPMLEQCAWVQKLWHIIRTWDRELPTKWDDVKLANATADQRCEALVVMKEEL